MFAHDSRAEAFRSLKGMRDPPHLEQVSFTQPCQASVGDWAGTLRRRLQQLVWHLASGMSRSCTRQRNLFGAILRGASGFLDVRLFMMSSPRMVCDLSSIFLQSRSDTIVPISRLSSCRRTSTNWRSLRLAVAWVPTLPNSRRAARVHVLTARVW